MGRSPRPNPLRRRWNRLLVEAGSGNLAVLGLLFAEIDRPLRAKIHKRFGHHHPTIDVDDLVHDTFLAVAASLGRYDPAKGSAFGWVWTICRNLALSKLRRPDARRRVGLEAVGEGALIDPQPWSPDVGLLRREKAVADQNRIARARAHLRRQPPPVRRAIRLRLKGHSYQETAALCEVPVGTVATWVRRWRQGIE
jgi:RNA polymerase sigma-70 factor, ECF subfamily